MDHRHPPSLVLFEPRVEGIGDATRQKRHFRDVDHHGRRPAERQSALGRNHHTAAADDEELGCSDLQMTLSGVEDKLVEGAGKALFGAERDDDVSFGTLPFLRLSLVVRSDGERLADCAGDNRRIGFDPRQLASGLERARCRASR